MRKIVTGVTGIFLAVVGAEAESRLFDISVDWGNALNQSRFYTITFAESEMEDANEIHSPPGNLQGLGSSLTFPANSIEWPSDVRVQNEGGHELIYLAFTRFRNAVGTPAGLCSGILSSPTEGWCSCIIPHDIASAIS